MKVWVFLGLGLLAACGGKGPVFLREPQVRSCTCEKCKCPHCVQDMAAICYCADKDRENKVVCKCGAKEKTCRCDHCQGYPQGSPSEKGCGCSK